MEHRCANTERSRSGPKRQKPQQKRGNRPAPTATNFGTDEKAGCRDGGDFGKHCKPHCLNQDLQDKLINKIKSMTIDEITYKINGCAMKVHNTLGNGFQEVIYQRCLAIELERAGLSFNRELEQTIYYENIVVGTRRADFVVENQIIVELKALINLEDVHLAQAKNYVVAYDFPIGLLINFGATSLQFKKVYNSKYNPKNV